MPAAPAISEEQFRALCQYMTRREIADQIDVTYSMVVHYEEKWGVKAKKGKLGRKPGEPIKVERQPRAVIRSNVPYRPCYWVQGGVWDDLRQTHVGA